MSAFDDLFETEAETDEAEGGAAADPSKPEPLTYEDFPAEDLYLYGGIDCLVTSGLVSKLVTEAAQVEPGRTSTETGSTKDITLPAILDSYLQIVVPSHEFIVDLELQGMEYSKERNRFYHAKMVEDAGRLEDQIFSALGKKINLRSGQEVSKLLYEEKGFTPPSYAKGGDPSTDGEALLTLAGLDPLTGKGPHGSYVTGDSATQFLAWMAKHKDIAGAHGTFIATYIDDFVKRDGKIHPRYNLNGTSSFRISGAEPNLTQLPRPKHGYNIRDCYGVPEGYAFIALDFSSAEMKVLAFLSGEPAMIRAVENGYDFHTASAALLKGVTYEEIAAVLADSKHPLFKEYKGLRQIAKTLSFSIVYGSSPAGIAAQLFISVERATELVNQYYATFPKVKDFIQRCHFEAKANQRIVTALGQHKRQFGTYPAFRGTAAANASLRNAQNVAVQSATSSLGLLTFAALAAEVKARWNANAICTVYDSIEIEAPLAHMAEVANFAMAFLDEFPMRQFPWAVAPIGNECELGLNWGRCRVVHPGVTQEECLRLFAETAQEDYDTFGFEIPDLSYLRNQAQLELPF